MPAPGYILALLGSFVLSLATWLAPRVETWSGARAGAPNVLAVMLGDGRRLFANHFFTRADVYFHSGYYPSVFDDKRLHERPAMADQSAEAHDHTGHEETDDVLGQPRDWVDRFGRNFFVTRHTHLQPGRQREMLPWLRLAATLDPHHVENYTISAFWLRTQLGKVDEAEQFLREGWRLNPDSPEILFELGQLLSANRKDVERARNVWELAYRKWHRQETAGWKPDPFVLEQILANLVQLEYEQENHARTLEHLRELKGISPFPEEIQRQIDTLQKLIQP